MEELNFNTNIYDTIRRNIKKYRKEKGMTSAKLAELVDLSHDFIRQIGKTESIKYFAENNYKKVIYIKIA